MADVLMNFTPEFARGIYSDSRGWWIPRRSIPNGVYRPGALVYDKCVPSYAGASRVYIYERKPIDRITGWFEVADVAMAETPTMLWGICGGRFVLLGRDQFDAYFAGCMLPSAYKIGRLKVFRRDWAPLSVIGLDRAPTNYRYLTPAQAETLDRFFGPIGDRYKGGRK